MKFDHVIRIDEKACIGCGLCQKDCPSSNLVIENKVARVVAQDCIMCAHCVAICPKGAVSMTGFDEAPANIDASSKLDPEELLRALRFRRSVRQFSSKEVAEETIECIFEGGRLTPTGKNAQAVEYVVLKEGRKAAEEVAVRLFRRLIPFVRLVDSTAKRTVIDDDFFFKKAPVVVVVVAENETDGALAASNMALVAEAHGLGVLYSGFFAMAVNTSRTLRKMLGLRRGQKAVAALVIGYPAVKYQRSAPKEKAIIRKI